MTESGQRIGPAQIIDIMRRLAEANVRYYASWASQTRNYADDVLATFLTMWSPSDAARTAAEAPTRAPGTRPVALLLEAQAGAHAEAAFVIHTNASERLRTRLSVPPFVDPSGAEISPAVVFEPDEIDLEPGQALVVRIRAEVDARMKPMVPYEAEIVVPGLPQTRIRLVLRRTPSPTRGGQREVRSKPKTRARSEKPKPASDNA